MNTLYNKYLSSVAGICFDTPNDQGKKTPQQLAAEERERISVTKTEVEKTPEQIEADTKAAEAKEAEEKETKEKEEKEAKEKEEAEKKKAAEAGGEDGGEEELGEQDQDPEKLKKTIERLQGRINKLTAKNKLTEGEKTELANKLKELEVTEGKKLLTEEDVETRSEEKANIKLAQRQFVEACNRLAESAAKIDKKFDEKVTAMAKDIGDIPSVMIAVLDDLENGGAVLNYLTDNLEDAERIYSLSPAKMGVELTKLSAKVDAETKAADEAKKKADKEKSKKEISKVPEHKEPPGGTAKTDTNLRDDEPMEDWVAKRNRQVAERQAAKRAGMR